MNARTSRQSRTKSPLETLDSVYGQQKVAIDRVADSLLEVSFKMATFDQYSGANTGTIARTAATSQKNLRQPLEEAKRRFPDASAAWYSTSLVIAGALAWDKVVCPDCGRGTVR